MSFYTEVAAIADDLIREFGATTILTRSVPGAYDPATGTVGTPTVTNYTGNAAAFDYAQRDIDGTRIRIGDQKVYLSTVGIVNPITGDTLTIGATLVGDVVTGGTPFTVVESRPLQPALTAVLYECQARGVR